MIPYLLLLILAIVTCAVIFWLIRTDRLPSIASWIVLLGISTSFLAMVVFQSMSLVHSLLVILGMSFAMAVLLAKQQEAK